MTKNRIYITLAVFLIGAILLYVDSPEQLLGTANTPESEQKIFPYATVDNASTQYFSEEGILDYTFEAQRLEHFRITKQRTRLLGGDNAPEEYTKIIAPRLVIYLPDKAWHIKSKEGKISDQGNIITLSDDVEVWLDDDKKSNTMLTTDSLKILPNEKFAETDKPVKITNGNGHLQAVGMQVRFADRTYKFLSGVRAHHDPL